MFVEDWFLMVRTDWEALEKGLQVLKKTAPIRINVFLMML